MSAALSRLCFVCQRECRCRCITRTITAEIFFFFLACLDLFEYTKGEKQRKRRNDELCRCQRKLEGVNIINTPCRLGEFRKLRD